MVGYGFAAREWVTLMTLAHQEAGSVNQTIAAHVVSNHAFLSGVWIKNIQASSDAEQAAQKTVGVFRLPLEISST